MSESSKDKEKINTNLNKQEVEKTETSNKNTRTQDETYDSSKIVVLDFPHSVRKLPGMYIGDPNEGGLEHLVKEILDNSVDEYFAGYANHIKINILSENTVEIEDNGRGMPVDVITYTDKYGNKLERSGIETIFTVLHAGAKSSGDGKGYKISGGLHGVGASVVNALSEYLEVYVYRDYEYYMKFEKGLVTIPLEKRGKTDKRGTFIRFQADTTIFKGKMNDHTLLNRIEEIAYLNSGLRIDFHSQALKLDKSFYFENGLMDFIQQMIGTQKTLIDPLYSALKEDNFEAYIVFTWCPEYEGERYALFTNNIPQPDGGYHLTGIKFGVFSTIKKYIDANTNKDYISSFLKKKIEIIGEDTRNGIHCICSVRCENPTFASQTKTKLSSPFVKPKVEKLISDSLGDFIEKNPTIAKKIVEEIFAHATARSVAREEKKKVLAKIDEVDSFSIPGKLAECDRRTPPEERELIIVEGDSAGGTVKQARDRKTQAVLSLFGKISNVMRMNTLRILNTETLMTIMAVLGININEDEETYKSKLRYHKVIIMVDADVDGGHIRTLLLTFFYKCAPFLLKNGHIYICRPPLYGVRTGGKLTYIRDENTFKDFVTTRLYEDYTFKSPAGELDFQTIRDIVNFGESYKKDLQQIWRGDIDLNALSYFVFLKNCAAHLPTHELGKLFKEEFNHMILEERLHDNGEKYYLVIEQTIYGTNQYVIDNWNLTIPDKILDIFPLEVTSKNKHMRLLKNPLNLFEYVDHIISKIDVQRYKGLGEMTTQQLYESTISMDVRVLIQVQFEDCLESTRIINDLMTIEGVDSRKRLIVEGMHSSKVC